MSVKYEELITQHYREVAQKYGPDASSTMEDRIVRTKEQDIISNFLRVAGGMNDRNLKVLDLGCGNGYMLSVVSQAQPNNRYVGLDLSHEMVSIAKDRALPNCLFLLGNARFLPFGAGSFDVIYSERCLINVLDPEEQISVVHQINGALKQGGYYFMIECFTDGLSNNNRARREFGMEEIQEAHHNKYLDKQAFFGAIQKIFRVIDPEELDMERGRSLLPFNFVSSHYFVTRVLFEVISKGRRGKNTEFARFFDFLPPVGNYSPIQAYILQKL